MYGDPAQGWQTRRSHTPLYFVVLGLLGRVVGLDYWLARTVSMLSVVGACALVGLVVARHARRRREGVVVALVAVGFVCAGSQASGYSYDHGRADAMAMLLLVASAAALGAPATPRRAVVAALAFAACLYTKQSTLPFALPLEALRAPARSPDRARLRGRARGGGPRPAGRARGGERRVVPALGDARDAPAGRRDEPRVLPPDDPLVGALRSRPARGDPARDAQASSVAASGALVGARGRLDPRGPTAGAQARRRPQQTRPGALRPPCGRRAGRPRSPRRLRGRGQAPARVARRGRRARDPRPRVVRRARRVGVPAAPGEPPPGDAARSLGRGAGGRRPRAEPPVPRPPPAPGGRAGREDGVLGAPHGVLPPRGRGPAGTPGAPARAERWRAAPGRWTSTPTASALAPSGSCSATRTAGSSGIATSRGASSTRLTPTSTGRRRRSRSSIGGSPPGRPREPSQRDCRF